MGDNRARGRDKLEAVRGIVEMQLRRVSGGTGIRLVLVSAVRAPPTRRHFESTSFSRCCNCGEGDAMLDKGQRLREYIRTGGLLNRDGRILALLPAELD